MNEQALSRRLAAVLAGEVAATLAADPTQALSLDPAEAEPGPGLRVQFKVSGAQTGTAIVWVPSATGAAAARAAGLAEQGISPEAVSNLLREAGTNAVDMAVQTAEFAALEIVVASVAPSSAPQNGSHFRFGFPDGGIGHVSSTASLGVTLESQSRSNGNLELVLDVELPLIVRFGRTVMSLKALSGLGPGSIVDMGRSPDDPVELLVSDKVVAYGEVVIVDGSYGLRITELVSPADRMKAVGLR